MTDCNGCGGCCDPVVLTYGPGDLRTLSALPAGRLEQVAGRDEAANIVFAVEHFTPIPRREGLARAPYLSQGGKTAWAADHHSEPVVAFSYFYACDRFDPDTRRCVDYENRPPLCAGYPWFGRSLDDPWNVEKALPSECSYRADIGQPVEIQPNPRRHP